MRTSTPGIASPTVPMTLRSGRVKRDDRAHLGRAVALQDLDAHVGPALRDVDLERRGAHADRVQPPAELAEDRAEEERDGARGAGGAPAGGAARTGVAPAGLVDLALDGVGQQLQALRHDQQHRDPEVAERADEDRGLAADRVDDARADQERRR